MADDAGNTDFGTTGDILPPDGNAQLAGDGLIAASERSNNASATDGLIIVDPASVGGPAGSGGDGTPGKRGRGRPRGSGAARTKKAAASIDISGLENILLSAHSMLAGITRVAELEMDETEAKKLAEAGAKVARHYDLAATAKQLDWTNLIMTVGTIYGTRLMAIRLRRTMERAGRTAEAAPAPTAQPRSNGQQTVTTFIPGVGNVEVPVN